MSQVETQLEGVEREAAEVNDALAAADPEKIVGWAHSRFAPDLVMSSSFGAESALLIHMAIRVMPRIKIIFVDTGFHFPETHQFVEQLRQRFDLNIWTYHTRKDPIAYLREAGEDNPLERKDRDACCEVNKNAPFERAMEDLQPKAWLRGVRADQTQVRGSSRFVAWSPRFNCFAISPLLSWTARDIFNYMKKHDLPYHPLYEKGYASIGCSPLSCTRPVQVGEDARSGRWSGSGKVECGINLINSLDSANL
jgi:phosphoadenosine phosphosulfate reductase